MMPPGQMAGYGYRDENAFLSDGQSCREHLKGLSLALLSTLTLMVSAKTSPKSEDTAFQDANKTWGRML